ncbi:MAG: hypothetical protein PUG71_04985 [bacterium]|nr:hypothetical protein [bacterium]
MQVHKMFQLLESEDVAIAYIATQTLFYEYDRYTVEEKMNATKKVIVAAEEMAARLASCELQTGDNKSRTIFVVSQQEDSYDKLGQYYFTSYFVEDAEALEKIHGDFRMWNEEGKARIEHYGYDFSMPEEIAGWNVSDVCIEKDGMLACATEILNEIFEFGYSDETRKKNQKNLEDELKKSIEELENGGGVSSSDDDFWEEMEKKLQEHMTEDEKEHRRLELEYEAKVEELERKACYKVMEENHQMNIELVREEYMRRL